MSAPRLSVVVNFYAMAREAPRTLHTLSAAYQQGIDAGDIEVIAVDNGSPEPLDEAMVTANGPGFRLLRIPPGNPSPCAAINRAVASSRGGIVMVCVDGARMLSPGVAWRTLAAFRAYPRPFVYTLGMHLGSRPQNDLVESGYDQLEEDALLATVDWRGDGYRLFSISSLALSSRNGYFSSVAESNCFALARADWDALGGFDERFASPGAGLANLDLFNRAHEAPGLQPVMLLGEATFHQFHGGVATNRPRRDHPWRQMAAEYERILGRPYATVWRPPEYLGTLTPERHGRLAGT